MSNIFILPGNDPQGNPLSFSRFLHDISKTKLLVLYDDAVAHEAHKAVVAIVEANPDDYVSVVFLFVKEPLSILQELKKLPINIGDPDHSLQWYMYPSYRVLSISPANKVISDAITATDLQQAYGAIKSSILYAFANG